VVLLVELSLSVLHLIMIAIYTNVSNGMIVRDIS